MKDSPKPMVAGFVLTGGASERMGQDKALLELSGEPLVLRAARVLEGLCAVPTLVGAPERYGHLGLPVLADSEEGKGPLAGIVTALRASDCEWNFILACDLPYLERNFLAFISALVLEGGADSGADPDSDNNSAIDAVIPRIAGRWQPLCAIYHRRCLPTFEHVLGSGHPKIADAFGALSVLSVGEDELERAGIPLRQLENVNTPEQYAEARLRLG